MDVIYKLFTNDFKYAPCTNYQNITLDFQGLVCRKKQRICA